MYIGQDDEVRGGVVSTDEYGIIVDVLRKINLVTIFYQVEAYTRTACLSTEVDITGNVLDFILLAQVRLFTNHFHGGAEVVNKATSDTWPCFVKVALFKAVELNFQIFIV